jgi:uncharacterized protein YbdZ (MbtH family)
MLSFKTNLAVAAFTLCANAQTQYQIDPNSVSLPIRQGWCSQQKATCPSLCLQLGPGASSTTTTNSCDPVRTSHFLLSSFQLANAKPRLLLNTLVSAETDYHPMLPNIPKLSHTSSVHSTVPTVSQDAVV